MEDPKYKEREWEAKFQNAFGAMPEATIWREPQEVLEVRREGTDHHGGGY